MIHFSHLIRVDVFISLCYYFMCLLKKRRQLPKAYFAKNNIQSHYTTKAMGVSTSSGAFQFSDGW
jgi:hypothetical protein